MTVYDKYLTNSDALPIAEALEIYTQMCDGLKKCSVPDKNNFASACLEKACRYSQIRMKWEFMTLEERSESDSGRTVTHNAFIDSLNILSRVISSDNIDVSWKEKLGDSRKRIGDFACFMAYMTGVGNR